MRLHIVKSGDVSGDAGVRGTQLLLGSEGPGSAGLEHPELASPHVVGTEFRVKAGGRGLSREEDGTREARRSWAPQSHAWPSPTPLWDGPISPPTDQLHLYEPIYCLFASKKTPVTYQSINYSSGHNKWPPGGNCPVPTRVHHVTLPNPTGPRFACARLPHLSPVDFLWPTHASSFDGDF